MTVAEHFGAFRHVSSLSSSQISQILKMHSAANVVILAWTVPAKTAIAILILRIRGVTAPKTFRWSLYGLCLMNLLIAISAILVTVLRCNPPSASWNNRPDKCLDPKPPSAFIIFAGGWWQTEYTLVNQMTNDRSAWGAVLDLILAIIPSTFVLSLQKLSLQKRLGICILLGLGLFTCITAIVKTVYLYELLYGNDVTCKPEALVFTDISNLT